MIGLDLGSWTAKAVRLGARPMVARVPSWVGVGGEGRLVGAAARAAWANGDPHVHRVLQDADGDGGRFPQRPLRDLLHAVLAPLGGDRAVALAVPPSSIAAPGAGRPRVLDELERAGVEVERLTGRPQAAVAAALERTGRQDHGRTLVADLGASAFTVDVLDGPEVVASASSRLAGEATDALLLGRILELCPTLLGRQGPSEPAGLLSSVDRHARQGLLAAEHCKCCLGQRTRDGADRPGDDLEVEWLEVEGGGPVPVTGDDLAAALAPVVAATARAVDEAAAGLRPALVVVCGGMAALPPLVAAVAARVGLPPEEIVVLGDDAAALGAALLGLRTAPCTVSVVAVDGAGVARPQAVVRRGQALPSDSSAVVVAGTPLLEVPSDCRRLATWVVFDDQRGASVDIPVVMDLPPVGGPRTLAVAVSLDRRRRLRVGLEIAGLRHEILQPDAGEGEGG